jgi:hypothetical protein
MESKPIKNVIQKVNFAKQMAKPVEEKDKGGFVKWGKKNDWPFFINELREGSPVHGGIIKNKIRYISGGGIEIVSGNLQEFLDNPNSDFTIEEVADAMTEDYEGFGGFIVKGTWDMEGTKVVKWEALPIDSCRFSEKIDRVYLSNDWNAQNQSLEKTGYRDYPIYNPENKSGSFFLFYKDPVKKNKKELGIYPKPPYFSGIYAIETDYLLNRYNNSLVQNSFSSGTLITMTDGVPETQEEINKAVAQIKEKSAGVDNAGDIIVTFAESKERAPLVQNLNGNDLDKRYDQTGKTCLQNILIAHGVVSPTLFGVMQQGSFNAAESAQLFEVFKKTYVMQRQERLNWMLNYMAELSGYVGELSLVEIQPIEDATNAAAVGPTVVVNNPSGTDAAGTTTEAAPIEDVSKTALNGAQIASLVDVVAKVKTGEINAESAAEIIIASFPSIDEATAKKMVGIEAATFSSCKHSHTFSKEDLEVFGEFGDSFADFQEFARLPIEWDSLATDVFIKHEEVFATIGEISAEMKDIDKQILSLLNNGEDSNAIAEATGSTIKDVALSIARLNDWGLIKNGELSALAELLIDSADGEIPEFEIRYSYQVRSDVPEAKSGSREFCTQLIALNKAYTRDEINTISSRVDRDVWKYRGGFYTNPDTQVTTPWCRHLWFQSIVTKK